MPTTFLTDAERRTLANLSIPRNVQDLAHQLRTDPHSPTLSENEVHAALEGGSALGEDEYAGLIEAGYVVNLGQHDDAAKLAAQLETGKSRTLEMGDEKAKLFSQIVNAPQHRWRMDGDLYMLTDEGLEAIKAPVPGVSAVPLSTERLEQLILSELQRVWKLEGYRYEGSIHDKAADVGDVLAGGVLLDKDGKPSPEWDEDGPALGQALLEQEWSEWAQGVADDHEKLTGRRPRMPVAGGAGWTAITGAKIIDNENGKTAWSVSAPWFMALSILAFTDADTGTTADNGSHKPTYSGYARKSVAAADMNAASGAGAASATNLNPIQFAGVASGTDVIVAFGHCDAATVGELRKYGTCASTTVSPTQTPAQFSAGQYSTSAD
jgi:hypothetical protein